ncbi:MAG: GFA family protein [Gammaproteobacteria bacterium]
MMKATHGGCLCGGTRYAFSSNILSCYACHCTDCQKRTGASFILNAIVPKTELNITQGSPEEVTWDIGKSTMCPDCGTHLWAVANLVPDFALIRVGTLDDTSWVDPVAHIWTRSAQPWIRFNDNAKQFAGMPENPLELIDLWAQRNAR